MSTEENKSSMHTAVSGDYQTMISMLRSIEVKLIAVDPIKQIQFLQPIKTMIFEAWSDACNPDDDFLFKKHPMPNPSTTGIPEDKKKFVALVLALAEHNSKDAETAEAYLKEQGINIDVKDAVLWIRWLAELHNLFKEATGDPNWYINTEEARKWYDSGATPYQTFRETYQNEG